MAIITTMIANAQPAKTKARFFIALIVKELEMRDRSFSCANCSSISNPSDEKWELKVTLPKSNDLRQIIFYWGLVKNKI